MSKVLLLCYAAYFVNLIVLVHHIWSTLFWAEDLAHAARRLVGTAMPRSQVVLCVALIAAYFVAYQYADLSGLWLIRAIAALTTSTLVYLGRAAAAGNPAMVNQIVDRVGWPEVPAQAASMRRWIILSIIECVVWTYAWRHLFGVP